MNNPFEYVPDKMCEDAFRRLIERIEGICEDDGPDALNFRKELEEGKMLGVMIAEDKEGRHHTLYAFSGQLGEGGFHHRGFVGPVFDYLQPDGYFKTKEREISRQNLAISRFENNVVHPLRREYEKAEAEMSARLNGYKEKCRISKHNRDAKREEGIADEKELQEMIRQSQFEKAELRRLKKSLEDDIAPIKRRLEAAVAELSVLKERRRMDSESLQRWLFDNFHLLNSRGESKNLTDIFADTSMKVPPSGAGECCAPKLLQAAYLQDWKPIAMAEYWYGKPKDGEVRIHGSHYPACRGKCLPVLRWMLQGLEITPEMEEVGRAGKTLAPEIIYENEWFCVVNKPSGMLSVPGKSGEISVEEWLIGHYGIGRQVKVAHRLDQDTSGLLLAAFGRDSLKVLQSLFIKRMVKKTYMADLEGDYRANGVARTGKISLPLSPDWLDRPRQRVDKERGKESVTDYEFVDMRDGKSRILFHPLTGRTHQLRVHAASPAGLGMPIAGDRLYGPDGGSAANRLHLHAHRIEFTFPMDNKNYSFEIPPGINDAF